MGTTIRPELSKNNKYWIEKHRYYELKHFCLQYNIWKQAMNSISCMSTASFVLVSKDKNISDPTGRIATAVYSYKERIEKVDLATSYLDPFVKDFVFLAVTNDYSYTYLRTKLLMPHSKDAYYTEYRKFFWYLNKIRD